MVPEALSDRLRHYFETYKLIPGYGGDVKVVDMYGPQRAAEVILASHADYQEIYGE
jgi:inorganic pyrophosphatase